VPRIELLNLNRACHGLLVSESTASFEEFVLQT